MSKLSIDFGTTNTVVAAWREASGFAETLRLPGLSARGAVGRPLLVPSLLYVRDGAAGDVIAGQAVRAAGYDTRADQRFFSSFKRGIATRTRPLAREIDGVAWDEADAGAAFLRCVMSSAAEAEGGAAEEIVLTVPVHSFEQYLKWLRDEAGVAGDVPLRIVDESTAAALGYDVRTPGDLVLVFDFGGGTLDVSLVRMPLAEDGGGVVLESRRRISSNGGGPSGNAAEARVLAKAGRVLGGDDVDHWLLDEVLSRCGVDRTEAGGAYAQLKLACEAAKIRLSTRESAEISVLDPDTFDTYRATFTRSQLEDLLDEHGFYSAVQKTLNQVMRTARARGVFAEDIAAVLLIGGTSQIPSVQRMLRAQFGAERVRSDRPFEAVAHGALGLAAGMGLDDFLYHAYGIRHLSPISGRHEWEEIIAAGTRYPLNEPVQLVLTASRDGQEAVELVIGEVEESAGGVSEVMFGDRAILMVDGSVELRRVVALNDQNGARTVASLDPPGRAGEDRIEVVFGVDHNRTLLVTVYDLLTNEVLLQDLPVVELR